MSLKIQTKILGFFVLGLFAVIRCTSENTVSPQSVVTDTVNHAEDITSSETWTADKVHNITSSLRITNAVLKIEAGANITFGQGASLSILDSAGLIADGSESSITFSAGSQKKGDWKYIYFDDKAMDDSCKLVNCTIEYGGGDAERPGMIYCDNSAPAIHGCTISNSASSGVILYGDCRRVEFHSNTISENDSAPIESFASNISFIGSNEYLNNTINYIKITDGEIVSNDMWYRHEIPYLIVDELEIKSKTLILNSGIEMNFQGDVGLTISQGGCLQANGEFSPIIFTGDEIGSWNGIYITATANSAECSFNNCYIEKGGRNIRYPANLILENASPNISNCSIQKSINYGIYIEGEFSPRIFTKNVVTENLRAPISVSANAAANIPLGQYNGNGEDVIEVRGTPQSPPVMRDGYWQDLGIPYKVVDTIQIQGCIVTLASGVTVLMTEQSGFEVTSQGGFIAEGISSKIFIQGSRPIMGFWNSIYFGNTASAQNCRLVNCEISYGGGNSMQAGMIYCDRLSPIIRNCIIQYSQTWGIYTVGNVTITDLQSNLFYNNGFGDYYSAP